MIQPWLVETDGPRLRRFGKLSEELGELQAVVARCIIQGIDAIDPSSGLSNRSRLENEVADVLAQLQLLGEEFILQNNEIARRIARKKQQMAEWEALVNDTTKPTL